MDDRAMNQPIAWPHSGYTYFPNVRGVISMALKVNTPYKGKVDDLILILTAMTGSISS